MVEQTVGDVHAATLAYVRDKVAFTSVPIYSYFALVGDDPSVQIVSNAQIAYVRHAMQVYDYEKYPVLSAAAPFKTGGRRVGTITPIFRPAPWRSNTSPTFMYIPTH